MLLNHARAVAGVLGLPNAVHRSVDRAASATDSDAHGPDANGASPTPPSKALKSGHDGPNTVVPDECCTR